MKLIASFLTVLSLVCLGSCHKTSHKIRVQNDSEIVLKAVNIGSLTFSNIQPNTKTDYQEIPEGTYDVTGDFSASITIEGKGKHLWSLQVDKVKDVYLLQDK